MIYFTADLHLNHSNIITYTNRPYRNITEMDRALITNWNSVVKDTDTIYHLGDFCLGGVDMARNYFLQLNGHIHVLPGSHDGRWWYGEYASKSGHEVVKEYPVVELTLDEYGSEGYPLTCVLSHYAHRVWSRSHYSSIHLFGHSHGKLSDLGRSMDVGVDVFPAPISIAKVVEIMKYKTVHNNTRRD